MRMVRDYPAGVAVFLRSRRKPPKYVTIEDIYQIDNTVVFDVLDMRGHKLRSATSPEIQAARQASAEGRVREFWCIPFGSFAELAVVVIDGREHLIG